MRGKRQRACVRWGLGLVLAVGCVEDDELGRPLDDGDEDDGAAEGKADDAHAAVASVCTTGYGYVDCHAIATTLDVNVAPYAFDWDAAPDGALVERLLGEIALGTFGPLDPGRQYAMGLSSGGYMSSRLAVEYPGEIAGIAIQSGSYATCISSLPCPVTAADLPQEHAPTLLMAGYWDAIVPLYTIDDDDYALEDNGTPVELHVVGNAVHQWTSHSAGWVLAWFSGALTGGQR